jgi:hypothetical protein
MTEVISALVVTVTGTVTEVEKLVNAPLDAPLPATNVVGNTKEFMLLTLTEYCVLAVAPAGTGYTTVSALIVWFVNKMTITVKESDFKISDVVLRII